MTLGTNLKSLRKSRGWTQIELAEKLNIAQQVVASYESDKKKPPIDRLQELSALFGVAVDDILGTKPVCVEPNEKHLHGNSRSAKIQELFDRLPPLEQRSFLKQVTAMVEKYGR